jgi:hypothetical protein
MSSCVSHKSGPVLYQLIDGDVIMTNRVPSGRVDTMKIYQHVFANTRARPRVLVFTDFENPLPNFDGVYVFLDAEANSADYPENANRLPYNKMLYLESAPKTKAKKSISIPFASLSFTERAESPLDLDNPVTYSKQPYFAVYLNSHCVPERETLYDKIVEFAQEHHLGEVHALSKCYGQHPETKKPLEDRFRAGKNSYLASATELYSQYQFVLAAENSFHPNYVTEKIVNVFFAGAIPIYMGSDFVFTLFNKDAFVYLNSVNEFSAKMSALALHPSAIKQMIERKKIAENTGLYFFSWHKSVADRFESRGEKTIKDDIYAAIKEIYKESQEK